MEIWDAYDRQGAKTGTDLVRGERIGEGLYHLVCEIVVRHAEGTISCCSGTSGRRPTQASRRSAREEAR